MTKNKIEEILKNVSKYVDLLQINRSFNFRFSLKGLTDSGKKLKLGPSCFGLKLYIMLDKLSSLSTNEKNEWATYINSYQVNESKFQKNSYIDPELINFYQSKNLKIYLKEITKITLNIFSKNKYDLRNLKLHNAVNAETKQAVSTLYDAGYKNSFLINQKYNNQEVISYLENLNWSKPWSAGAQFASLCVFSKTQGYNQENLLYDFINNLVDESTGTYHNLSSDVTIREKINGSMKVISGLTWLNRPIHYPEKLIDFCLENQPIEEGCDLVDYIYVLYNCLKQVNYRKDEIVNIFSKMIDSFQLLQFEDGGFSYFVDKSQTHYYGVEVSKGNKVSDIHGTVLITWANILILDIITDGDHKFKIIKP